MGVSKQGGSYYVGGASGGSDEIEYAAGGMRQIKLGNGLWDERRHNNQLLPVRMGMGGPRGGPTS